ncbi:TPA: hypothetical protein ACKQDZ_002139 [Serratia rubidaea]
MSRDKTDYRKRLALIAQLRQQPSDGGRAILQRMLQEDFVLSVRQAAWQALHEQGVSCKRPKAPKPVPLLPPERRCRGCWKRSMTCCGRGRNLRQPERRIDTRAVKIRHPGP